MEVPPQYPLVLLLSLLPMVAVATRGLISRDFPGYTFELQSCSVEKVAITSREERGGGALGGSRGPWLGLHGPSSHYMGPNGC